MALRLYDELEKAEELSPQLSLEEYRFSISSEDEKLNELDPLHSSNTDDIAFDDFDGLPLRILPKRSQPPRKVKKLQGFLSRREARARRIQKWKSRILVPGRLCCVVSLVIAAVILGIVGMSGYWIVKRGTIDGQSPPWYPSPKGGTVRTWQGSYIKAAAMVSNMSLAEKVNVTTGTGWMTGLCVGNTGPAFNAGFPSLCLQDGPLGIRFADHITATPAGITVGATWNKELMYKRGKLLGLENRMKGINVMLGPSVGPLGKLPAGGRNWEGFGSDPVLQGWAAAQTIKGIQEEGVIATIKHFIANEQEHFRQPYEWSVVNALSSNIDDRTLHEVYAWPFADSVKAGVASVMCSYNQVNNSYACQNSKILNGLLKDELGFQGFVQSDWTAQHSGVGSALAGLDMAMPGGGIPNGAPYWGPLLTMAILNGSLPMDRLDDMVTRIVAAWYQLGQDDVEKWPPPPPVGEGGPNFSSWTNDEIGLLHPGTDDTATGKVNSFINAQNAGRYSHSALARRIAAEGIVLLKNTGHILPLSRKGWPQGMSEDSHFERKYRIAVIGEDSVLPEGGPNVCPDRGCNRGTLASGWGSGAVEFPYLVSPLEALQNIFHNDSVDLKSYPTNDLGKHALELQESDLCIVFANADAGEGFLSWDKVKGDRNDLFLQKDGDKLINTVASNCGVNNPNGTYGAELQARGGTIVVIHSVGPVILESFIELDNVHAVVFANLPGQESGNALTDVLLGDVNPSGHLPFTIGKTLEDYGAGAEIIYKHVGDAPQQDFHEGLLIDYRWFDAQQLTPRFPFGYGLSYTTFELKNMTITTPFASGQRPDELPRARPKNDCDSPRYSHRFPDPAELVFPADFRKLKNYIYPYIENVEQVGNGTYPYPNMTSGTLSAAGGGEGGNPSLWDTVATVNVTVVNTGGRDGQAVVQLYVAFPDDVYEDIPQEDAIGDQSSDPTIASNAIADKINSIGSDVDLEQRENGSGSYYHMGHLVDDDQAHDQSAVLDQMRAQTSVTPSNKLYAESRKRYFHDKVSAVTSPFRKSKEPEPKPKPTKEKIDFPPRVLRAFEKVHTYTKRDGDGSSMFVPVRTGVVKELEYTANKANVTFNLTRRDLSYWSVRQQNWVLPAGSFRIEVGFDSRDLRVGGVLF